MSLHLPETKKTLEKLSNRYAEIINYAVTDIKPNYGHGNTGSNYLNIHTGDADFVYQSICYLRVWLQEPLFYDWSFYVTDTKAIENLDKAKADILDRYDKLKSIERVDKEKGANIHPIELCLIYYRNIIGILDDIYNSQEFIEFKNPNIIEENKKLIEDNEELSERNSTLIEKNNSLIEENRKLIDENKKLKFDLWWRKRCRKCLLHLVCFIVFLGLAIWAILIKESSHNRLILLFLSLLTLCFNLLFNNHQSFKDSWKIIRSSDRKILKDKYFNDPKMWQNI